MSYKGIVATSGKSMLMAITLASIMSLPRAMFAATATVNGITWTYTVSNGEASLGGGTSSSPAILLRQLEQSRSRQNSAAIQ